MNLACGVVGVCTIATLAALQADRIDLLPPEPAPIPGAVSPAHAPGAPHFLSQKGGGALRALPTAEYMMGLKVLCRLDLQRRGACADI